MVAQLTYDVDPAIGFKGMLSQNFNQPKQLESRISEGGTILYGNAVEAGTLAEQVVTLAAAADFAGVAIFAHTQESSTGYDAGKSLPIMTKGRVWVLSGGVVTVGAEVVPDTAADTRFVVGTATSDLKAIALTAAAATGDLIEIELLGPQL